MSTISSNRNQPLVSVVIPAYNAGKTLAATLTSLAQQTYQHVEVIVVDDGSTDDTWNLLQSPPLPVHAVRQSNAGLAAARNAGLKHARGDYIALLDADDLCTPDRLAVQVAYMETQPELLLCCSDFSAFNAGGVLAESYSARYYHAIGRAKHGMQSLLPQREQLNLAAWLPSPYDQSVVTYRGQVYMALTHGNFVHPPTIMLRRSVIETVGMFEIEARSMCDWDWIVRVARAGQIGYIDRPLLRYRLSNTQMSSNMHRVRAQLDIVHVAERIVQRDPALYQSQRYRQEIGRDCINAADALADTQPLQALRWLTYAATRYGTVNTSSLRVMIKSLMPMSVLSTLRRLRGIDPAKAAPPRTNLN